MTQTEESQAKLIEQLPEKRTKVPVLCDIWNILINREAVVFEKWITATTLSVSCEDKCSHRAEQMRALKKRQRSLLIQKAKSELVGGIATLSHNVLGRLAPDMSERIAAEELQTQNAIAEYNTNIHDITTVQIIIDELAAQRVTYAGMLEKTTPLIMKWLFSAAIPITLSIQDVIDLDVKNGKALLSLASMEDIDARCRCIDRIYLNGLGPQEEKIIDEALQFICSVNVELAKQVIRIHNGDLIHVLDDGSCCTRCQTV
jgi:hypothetical protein